MDPNAYVFDGRDVSTAQTSGYYVFRNVGIRLTFDAASCFVGTESIKLGFTACLCEGL